MKTKILYGLLLFSPILMAPPMGDFTEPVKERSSSVEQELKRRARAEKTQQEEDALREQAQRDREKGNKATRLTAKPEARDFAPTRPEDITPRTVTRIKIEEATPKPHEPSSRFGGRSHFMEALRNDDLTTMKTLWDESKYDRTTTTEEFVQPLKDMYNNVAKMKEMFPKLTYDQARETLTIKLLEVSPFLGKTFIDSFRELKTTRSDINNPDFLLKLQENPRLLTTPELKQGNTFVKEQTPLETAIAEGNTEVAQYIIDLAKYYKIKPAVLLEPIINEYKKAMKNTPETIAKKVDALGIPRLTELFQAQTNALAQA